MKSIIFYKSKIAKLLSRFGFGNGLKLTASEFALKELSFSKLHIGCGNIHIKDWTNIDILATGSTDLVCDITNLNGIKSNSVDAIYSCHVLEHFETSRIIPILTEWHRVLKKDGELRISVPDLDAITKIYQNNLSHFQTPGHEPWIALFYGGQKDQFDFHKTGFNFCWIKYLLENIGFKNVQKYSNEPHFIDGVIDNSTAQSFNQYISLNVVATKID